MGQLSRFASAALLITFVSLTGCKPDAALKKSEVIGKGTSTATSSSDGPQSASAPNVASSIAPPDSVGGVSGVISFSGKVPAKVRIDTTMDPACNMGPAADVYSEQYAVTAGKLANVFIYVKQGPAAAMQSAKAPAAPTILDQKHCQYTPHVVGIMQGGYVEFRNSDPTMHNIHTMPTVVGNDTIDVSQSPRGAAQSKQFRKPELMIPVRCNNHPWMNAFVNVSETPFFAVTDSAGAFSLTGLPPGDYVLGAVHEKMGEKTINITIKPRTTAQADTSFSL